MHLSISLLLSSKRYARCMYVFACVFQTIAHNSIFFFIMMDFHTKNWNLMRYDKARAS